MALSTWTCPLDQGGSCEELLITYGSGFARKVLIIPPLFDEHNKLRRQLIMVMRELAAGGVGSFLPDLPGTNESLIDLRKQSLTGWRKAISAFRSEYETDRFFSVRSGAILVTEESVGLAYSPHSGAAHLRDMVRSRVLTSREAGRHVSSDAVYAVAREHGAALGGWEIGPQMFRELELAELPTSEKIAIVDHDGIGGPKLWLRAEAGSDTRQAVALAEIMLASFEIQT